MNNLSIVFQGPKTPVLHHALKLTQRAFPLAEIIVSSWRISPTADRALAAELLLLGVRLVLSDDPGQLTGRDASGTWSTNLNRLLVSSHAGLAAASRPLAIKLRTDSWLSGRQLAPLLAQTVSQQAGPPRDASRQVFRSRVINASLFARDARGSLPLLFHPGDILLAGRTDDLRLFFSAPLAGPELFGPAFLPGMWVPWRYVAEQWFWIHSIRRTTGQDIFSGNATHSAALVTESERYFLANFVPYSSRQLGFHWPKYWRCYPLRGLFSVYSHARWQRLARRYQGLCVRSPRAAVSCLLTTLWHGGYCLRVRVLRYPRLRSLARKLFTHHQ